jgi:DNA-binding response OmpR family regulator
MVRSVLYQKMQPTVWRFNVPTRIMVFNDTKEILELFEMILCDEGYEVSLFSYTVDEIRLIQEQKPDLLILDYTVGRERNGWQLLQKIKMVRATASIPVLICTTSYKLAEEIEGYLAAKKVTIVRKPFDVDELVYAVKDALGEVGPGDTLEAKQASS